ncbi:hypothetical protein RHO13_12425 [Orbus wheelerorum]|uniref:hypothetical protein n=1 Tax=Orbus wheelerorum TaxID=3074111 RepID=UPI00370D6226
MKKLVMISLAFLMISLTGCGSVYSGKMYEHSAQSADPTLTFSSDYGYYTKFWINSDAPAEQRLCKNTDEIGFLLYENSIFLFDKPMTNLSISVESDKEITITGTTYGDGSSCGPLEKAFTPEKNKNYLIHYEKAGNYCRMNISEKDSDTEVAARQVASCVK